MGYADTGSGSYVPGRSGFLGPRLARLRTGLTARLGATSAITRQAALIAANAVVVGAGGMIFWIVAARLETPSVTGLATAGVSLVVLLSQLGQLGLGVSIVRFRDASISATTAGVVVTTAVVAAMSGCLAYGLIVTIPLAFPQLSPLAESTPQTLIFTGATVAWAASLQLDSVLISRQRGLLLVSKSGAMCVLRLVVLPFLSVRSADSVIVATGVGATAALLIPGLAALRRHRAISSQKPTRSVSWQRLIAFSLLNHLSSLSGVVPPLVAAPMIVALSSAQQAAAYYMCWSLFTVLQLFPASLSWALLANGSSRGASQRSSMGGRRLAAVSVAFIVLGIVFLRALGPSYLRDGVSPLVLLTVGFFPYDRAMLLLAEIRLRGSQLLLAFSYCASQAVFLGVAYVCLPQFGAAGAAAAWILGQFVLLGLLTLSLRVSAREAV